MAINEAVFRVALHQMKSSYLVEIAREQANKWVKEGTPYNAHLVRELCDRLELAEKKP